LDSIAEESEHSEISLRSTNSITEKESTVNYIEINHKDNQRNSIVVHMDAEQQPELDSSCDTGSFEPNDPPGQFSPRNS
jgi:hypothetical protein